MYRSRNKVAMHNAIDDSGFCSQPRGVKPWMHISEEMRITRCVFLAFACRREKMLLCTCLYNDGMEQPGVKQPQPYHFLTIPMPSSIELQHHAQHFFSPSYTSQHVSSPHISIPCNHPMTAQSHSQSPVRTAFPDTRVDASFTRRVACVCATLGRFLGCVSWLAVAEVELCGLDQVDGYGQEDRGLGGGCGT